MTENVDLFTAQTSIVFETLESNGRYVVKREFIARKYGEAAPVMLKAYDWFVRQLAQKVPRPEGAEYPVWLFSDPAYAMVHPTQKLTRLSVPEDRLILFDNKGWEKVLSMNYVETDSDDLRRFEKKLDQFGLDCGFTAFEKPFYPQIRSEIESSWPRIFSLKQGSVVRAATWELLPEWLRN